MEIISIHTTSTSLVVPIRAYNRLTIFAILGIASFFVGPEHQASKIYEYSQRGMSSQTNTLDNPNIFSNYVKTTPKHGPSLSEADLGDLKREMTKHGSSLMEVDWGGNIEPNYTSSGCMLMQVDWGGKLRVNHINECMPSEVDWGAHEPSKWTQHH